MSIKTQIKILLLPDKTGKWAYEPNGCAKQTVNGFIRRCANSLASSALLFGRRTVTRIGFYLSKHCKGRRSQIIFDL